MRAVITGATGFAGKWLVKELLEQNDEVTVVVRDKNNLPDEWNEKVSVVEASLSQLSGLCADSFSVGSADIFFHMAWAGTSGMERADTSLQLDNVRAACDAVRLAGRLKCKRFVNAGSIMEYEAMQYIPSENAVPGMGNIYSTAKLAADFMAKTVSKQEKIEYINLIISNIYGAGEKSPRFLNTTLRKMLRNEDVALTTGDQLYDFIYVTDAAKAIVFAGKNGRPDSTCYIGNPEQFPLKEFVLRMKKVLQSNSGLLFGAVPFAGASLSYHEFDTRKLEKMGFAPEVFFEQGVLLTRDWILEENDAY